VAVVDLSGALHPPGLHAAGVKLARLLMLRPANPALAVRAAEELLRHGAFPVVVLLGLEPGAPQARRLLLAAEAGRAVGVFVGEGRVAARASCVTRLSADRIDGEASVRVVRRQGGPTGQIIRMDSSERIRVEQDGMRVARAVPAPAPAARAAGA